MKETHYFYAPGALSDGELPPDEAAHCLRVLRLGTGDELGLVDGAGNYLRAVLTEASAKRCRFDVLAVEPQAKEWGGHLHLAVAPTKHMDRMEWLAEKATEIGFDELTFLDCRHGERKVVKEERIERIVVAAMKQSHKAFKPAVHGMEAFKTFVSRPFDGQKFIAHCYDEADVAGEQKAEADKRMDGGKPFLLDLLDANSDALVMVGPEGDFSIEEVRLAIDCGFQSVSLGRSRLRTETAALVAVHLMRIRHGK